MLNGREKKNKKRPGLVHFEKYRFLSSAKVSSSTFFVNFPQFIFCGLAERKKIKKAVQRNNFKLKKQTKNWKLVPV